jgi:hypothetical protein
MNSNAAAIPEAGTTNIVNINASICEKFESC